MEIIKSSTELTKKEIYSATQGQTVNISKLNNDYLIEVDKWILYKDVNAKDEELEILSIITPYGEVVSTISETFKKNFFKIMDLNLEKTCITPFHGKTKNDRDFVDCILDLNNSID